MDDSELPPPAPEPDRPAPEDPRELLAVRHRIAGYYLLATAALCLLTPASWWLLSWSTAPALPPTLGLWAVAAIALMACRLPPRRVGAGVVGVAVLACVAIGSLALYFGFGTGMAGLDFLALHAALVAVIVSPLSGALVGAVGVAMVGVVAWSNANAAVPLAPISLAFGLHTLLIVSAVAGGWTVAHFLMRFMRTAEERQQRFQGLLQITADAYWELDPQYRLVAVTLERDGGRALGAEAGVGSVPWELPAFDCDPDTLDRLQADLGARQRFRDVPIQWRGPHGLRHFMVSGEPRADARGVFQGFWGVARDVTEAQLAHQSLMLTESRYHDLFVCIPSPLVLHRDGRVIDANPAALTMFGHLDLASMLGSDILNSYDGGDSRERARRRAEALQALAPGEALPVAEFQIVARDGRRLTVRATGVAVATDEGPGVLSIYVDDTERQAAEHAVRRSEALLSHLVASSPDVITLTDLGTGRYAMVNQTFEQVTGWAADQVIGRTSMDIAIWSSTEEREHFASLVRDQGRVKDLPVTFRRRDGSPVPMRVSGARFVMDRRDYLVINALDVSQAELSRMEREAILENASIGIALTRDQRFQMVNPAFEAMLGWPPGAIVGEPGAIVWPTPEDYAAVGRRIGPALARGEQTEIECEVRRRDGSRFLCRMLARAVDPSHPSLGGTIWIVEDITERRRVDEALARARDEAEAASRAKSAFLANTSHELRTPLNGLLGLAQLARSPSTTADKRTQYLDQIVDSAQSLALIVSDILDLSKIEAGKVALEAQPFDLPAMLQSMHRGYTILATDRPLTLALEVDPALGWLRGDAMRVRQILTNYLSNAIKFTPTGKVRLVAKALQPQGLRIEVHDTGPGIAQAVLLRLFKPFSQADDSTTRRYGGTGLGLSICRELAELMGGQVGVDSQPGQGSCFWAELPLPPATGDERPAPPALDDAHVLQHGHVLVVDDNEINMMVAVAQLEQLGLRVGQAGDGRAALEAVAAAQAAGDPFVLIMMDLQMPVLSGFEVTRDLRQRYSADELPIVAHTAAALVTEREAALAAGMNDFLPKPTDAARLRATIAHWLRRRPKA